MFRPKVSRSVIAVLGIHEIRVFGMKKGRQAMSPKFPGTGPHGSFVLVVAKECKISCRNLGM